MPRDLRTSAEKLATRLQNSGAAISDRQVAQDVGRAVSVIRSLCEELRKADQDARRAEQVSAFLEASAEDRASARTAVLTDEALESGGSTETARELGHLRRKLRERATALRLMRERAERCERESANWARFQRERGEATDPLAHPGHRRD